MLNCPRCQGTLVIKNGLTYLGKQNYKCRSCGRQFVENPQQKLISPETWKQVDKLLMEKISLAGIARVVGISKVWLQRYVNRLYKTQKLETPIVKKSPTKKKRNKIKIWLVLEKTTRRVVGLHIGVNEM